MKLGTIAEPTTTLTDYALAVLAVSLGTMLWAPEWKSSPATLWAVGYYVIAAAATTGGTFHGFGTMMRPSVRSALWNVTVFLIGLSAGFMIAGAGASSIAWGDPSTRWLLAGLGTSAFGALIQQSGWEPHRNFNHNDMSHLAFMVALVFFFLGARGG